MVSPDSLSDSPVAATGSVGDDVPSVKEQIDSWLGQSVYKSYLGSDYMEHFQPRGSNLTLFGIPETKLHPWVKIKPGVDILPCNGFSLGLKLCEHA
jgi:hypothetical protein